MNVLTSILLICAAGMTLAWLVAAQRRLAARRDIDGKVFCNGIER